MDKKIILLIMILCFNISSSFDSTFNWLQPNTVCPTIGLESSTINWLVLSLIGVFTVFAIAVIVYLIGKAVGLPNISAWGKNEMWQIIASIILIVLLLALIGPLDEVGKLNNPSCPNPGDCDVTLCGYADPTEPGAGCTLLQTGYYYSEAMSAELMYLGYHFLVTNLLLEGFFSSTLEIVPLNLIGVTFNYSPMFTLVAKITDWSLVILLPAILSWIGNMFILCFSSGTMFALFLPLGLILRSFPSTRSVGGGLIALALGLYFIYPLMLNINNVIMSSYLGLDSPSHMINYAQDRLFAFPPSINRPGREITNAIVTPLYKTFKEFVLTGDRPDLLINPLTYPFIGGMISNVYLDAFYSILQEGVFLVMIGSFILPLLNIFITFTFIQEIGKFLGSDMNLAELVKLI